MSKPVEAISAFIHRAEPLALHPNKAVTVELEYYIVRGVRSTCNTHWKTIILEAKKSKVERWYLETEYHRESFHPRSGLTQQNEPFLFKTRQEAESVRSILFKPGTPIVLRSTLVEED